MTTTTNERQSMPKRHIPKALKEQVWLAYNGPRFQSKCHVAWCQNIITPFTFEVGHNVPESRGGTMDIANLRTVCSKCNKSMGASYTIDEFSKLSTPLQPPGCSGALVQWWRKATKGSRVVPTRAQPRA